MKAITLSSKNIDKVLFILKDKLSYKESVLNRGFILPATKKVLSTRYTGKGRPKKVDYDYVEIDWRKHFGSHNLV